MSETIVSPVLTDVLGADQLPVLDADLLRKLCLDFGADDVGFVALDRPELDDQRQEILTALPGTGFLISFVVRMSRAPLRSPLRSLANNEFHHAGDQTNLVAARIVRSLEDLGIAALNPPVGFPMEMSRFPADKIWVVAHKPVAEAAGLGKMGIHRNVIHPKFGNFILLGTVLVRAELTSQTQPIDFNPCMSCKLCVAACPVGAIHPDGYFDFAACYTHNYRDFMGGFGDWAGTLADSRSRTDYQERVSDSESGSLWQSLSFGANYKAAYCLAVCPAGEEVIAPFTANRAAFVAETLKPLQQKEEVLYVLPESDAEAHAARRFPHKRLKRVDSGLRPDSVRSFLSGLRLRFQRRQAREVVRVYHFTFSGAEPGLATVSIRQGVLEVHAEQHLGKADIHIQADSRSWVQFLRKERALPGLLLRRKLRFRGDLRAMQDFKRCFLG